MPYVLLLVSLLVLLIAPAFWAQRILRRNQSPRPDIPGTGGELANHLVRRFQLTDVGVEKIPAGDHYDPVQRKIRLSPANMEGRSLAAVACATHEFGHALQHATGYRPLIWRGRWVAIAMAAERFASALFVAAPLMGVLTRAPHASAAFLLTAVLMMSLTTIVHIITLPVEFDASFRRALPILEQGEYVSQEDLGEVRRILRACALTYVAASLGSLLNIGRWLVILRRR